MLRALHEENDVSFRLGRSVTGYEAGEAVLDDGARLPADLVLVGIGVKPRLALAEAVGSRWRNGVVVDATMRTSDPDVYAAGRHRRLPRPGVGRAHPRRHWVVCRAPGPDGGARHDGVASPPTTDPRPSSGPSSTTSRCLRRPCRGCRPGRARRRCERARLRRRGSSSRAKSGLWPPPVATRRRWRRALRCGGARGSSPSPRPPPCGEISSPATSPIFGRSQRHERAAGGRPRMGGGAERAVIMPLSTPSPAGGRALPAARPRPGRLLAAARRPPRGLRSR